LADVKIVVVGLGGCGCNIVKYMSTQQIYTGLQLYCCTTELVRSGFNEHINYIQLGESITHGLSTGGSVEKGTAAAEATRELLIAAFRDVDVVIVCVGLGGGTGTGALSVVLKICKDLAVLSLVMATLPFSFEGKTKALIATKKTQEVIADGFNIILIDNKKLSAVLDKKTPLIETFNHVNQIIFSSLVVMLELIIDTSTINLDVADLNTILSQPGLACMGQVTLTSEHIEGLSNSSFVSSISPALDISKGKNAVLYISAKQIALRDFNSIGTVFQAQLHPSALVITGFNKDEFLGEQINIFYLISGIT
jgi:cell division protein FtsZ